MSRKQISELQEVIKEQALHIRVLNISSWPNVTRTSPEYQDRIRIRRYQGVIRKLCVGLVVPRLDPLLSTENPKKDIATRLVRELRAMIGTRHAGVRTVHWKLNRGRESRVNIQAVHIIMKIKGWLIKKRPKGVGPRVDGWASMTSKHAVH